MSYNSSPAPFSCKEKGEIASDYIKQGWRICVPGNYITELCLTATATLETDRHRPVVEEAYLHVCCKPAGLDFFAQQLTELGDEIFIKRLSSSRAPWEDLMASRVNFS